MNVEKTRLIIKAIERLRQVQPDIQAQHIVTLLLVSEAGTAVQKDIEVAIAMSNASTSRIVDYWVEKDIMGRMEDPEDRRFKLLALTPKGIRLVSEMVGE